MPEVFVLTLYFLLDEASQIVGDQLINVINVRRSWTTGEGDRYFFLIYFFVVTFRVHKAFGHQYDAPIGRLLVRFCRARLVGFFRKRSRHDYGTIGTMVKARKPQVLL